MSSKFVATCFIAVFLSSFASAQPGVAPTPHLAPDKEKAKIKLPAGFELQLVAAEPDIKKPMNIAFDDKGRLWITETEEYPYPAPPDRKGKDSVKILEDFGPDGRARKITTFADGLNIPIGILPVKDGAIVYSIPNIWKLTDTDGDGKCDKREVLFGPFGTRDTHGMTNSFTMGFDGWVYACHGYLNDTEIKGKDGHIVKMNSGNTYRFKPDGSRVEIYTRGQVNPFGMTWDPYGNLYTADCHSRPITQLIRGAMYESFAKPHDGLGFAPHMNDFKDHSTALCGIVYYAADYFPKELHDHLFVGDVMHNRVNSYKVEYTGSSPRAIREDFLTSEDPWFRPVDLKLGPDGALYIADFYNKIIGHYEVPLTHPERDRTSGRIWRVVRKDKSPAAPISDYGKATDAELIKTLGHPNLTAAMYATHELAGRTSWNILVETLNNNPSPEVAAYAIWTLERQGKLSKELWQEVFEKKHSLTRVHAIRVAAMESSVKYGVISAMRDTDPRVHRAVTEAVGLLRHNSELPRLMELRKRVDEKDTHLMYSFRLACRRHIAQDFVRLSRDDQDLIADVLLSLPNGGGAKLAAEYCFRRETLPPKSAEFVEMVFRFGDMGSEVHRMLDRCKREPSVLAQLQLLAAAERGFSARRDSEMPWLMGWASGLATRLVNSAVDEDLLLASEIIARYRIAWAEAEMVKTVSNSKRSGATRAGALNALDAINRDKHLILVERCFEDVTMDSAVRDRAARILAATKSESSRKALVAALASTPATLASVIAEGLAGSREGAEELLTAVAAGKASPRLLQEQPVKVRLQATRLPNVNDRIAKLTAGIPPAEQRYADLFKKRLQNYNSAKFDSGIGAKVYEKHCAICHQLGGKGAKVGPQLDGIGKRGAERLLEDMLDPNRNIDPAFRTTRIMLKNGRDVSGLFLREEGEVTILADNQGKEVRIPKAQIDERNVIPLSPMPANIVDQIAETEFLHLLEFLLQQQIEAKRSE